MVFSHMTKYPIPIGWHTQNVPHPNHLVGGHVHSSKAVVDVRRISCFLVHSKRERVSVFTAYELRREVGRALLTHTVSVRFETKD